MILSNSPKNNVSIFQIPIHRFFRKAQGYDLKHRAGVYRGGKLKVYELRTMLNIKIAFEHCVVQ